MRLTIKSKLAAVFTIVVGISGVSMFMALGNLGAINDEMERTINGPVLRSGVVQELQYDMAAIANDSRAMIIEDDMDRLRQIRAEMDTRLGEVIEHAQKITGKFVLPESNADMVAINEALAKYRAATPRFQDAAMANSDEAAFEMSFGAAQEAFVALELSMTDLRTSLAARTEAGQPGAFEAYRAVNDLMLEVARTFRQHRNILLAAGDEAMQTEWIDNYRTETEKLVALVDGLARAAGPADQQTMARIRTGMAALTQVMDDTNALAGLRSNAQAISLLETELAPLRTQISSLVDTIVERNQAQLSRTVANASELYENSRMMLIGLLIASIAIAVIAATWIVVAISRALASAVRLASEVADGDLNASASVKTDDEVGDLIKALNAMTAKLREVVGEVTTATRNVASGSQEMSATAEQLSQGATEQASSTEEASASVEEIAATIKQSADNAAQTEKIARRSAADAIASGEAVDNAVNAMRTIAEKIMVVQEIARQTDLLALNAAVEAARAGEHGRGFAVVASEVRKLAERSQAAAAEISTLSGDTVQAAQTAGEMLSKLVPDIQRTAELVEEISAASREQNAGAAQINTAIQQLDQVTQQNTSAAEEMSATSEELASQAEQLQAAIGYFRLDTRTAAPAPAIREARRETPAKPARAAKAAAKRPTPSAGGFELEMEEGQDELDGQFSRRSAA
ncbi:MAG: methyl-accepting chemotaxis protein [Paracoccus sp. (in: a-proteobacteria)]|uniref:HAMP domain-containing methyl-accepting chemotaxis protein n=1 Tax=Paracoccus sp. TaxID=267 RepID=UPI00391B060E